MIRNLKILMLAAMVLGVFGAYSASGASAAEEFHCEAEPCRFTLKPDGTGTTAHHVLVVKNSIGESISFTCEQLTGGGTSATKTATEITLNTELKYDNCKSVLGVATVHFNGCHYKFTSGGGGADKGTVSVVCPSGKVIEITNGPCTATIGPQAVLTGIGFHVINISPVQLTMTAKVPSITVTLHGECGIELTKTPITSEYTTGNTIVTGETTSGVGVNTWWE